LVDKYEALVVLLHSMNSVTKAELDDMRAHPDSDTGGLESFIRTAREKVRDYRETYGAVLSGKKYVDILQSLPKGGRNTLLIPLFEFQRSISWRQSYRRTCAIFITGRWN
jgi:hypothetical protein